MVFQSYALYPHMNVRQNISFSLDIAHLPRDRIRKRVAEVARMLQLEELLDRRPAQLSGGQRQRVAIGRALVREPEVFLFDEPLSNLDAKLRVQMRVELANLHQQLRTTMIYVTHDQVEAMTLADKIVVLDRARISQIGTPLELYRRPANKFVASFIGSPAMNFLPARIEAAKGPKAKVTLGPSGYAHAPVRGTAPTAAEGLEFGIRPEHVQLGKPDAEARSLEGEVRIVEHLGNSTIVHVETPAGAVVVEADGNARARPGDLVGLTFDEVEGHLFSADGQAV
jgi:multiple sugar transport system ATP-binding protein